MEKRSLKSIHSGSQIILKPLSNFSTHIQSRRSLLNKIPLQSGSLSPNKHFPANPPPIKAPSHSLSKLSVSSSSTDIKSYLISNLKLMHPQKHPTKEKIPKSNPKKNNSMLYDISKYNLSTIPNQLPKTVTNISSKTVTGTTAGRAKKQNQDAFFALHNFNDTQNEAFIGVMDGHGVYGGQVSNFVKSMLPSCFGNLLSQEGNI